MDSGFDVEDGQLLFHTSFEEFQTLVESGVFQILGYAAIKINEALASTRLDVDNDIPWEVREYLSVRMKRKNNNNRRGT